MRKIEEILRLHFEEHRSQREIAQALKVARATVKDYLRRARLASIGWPLPADMTQLALDMLLFPPVSPPQIKRPEPDWAVVHREMGRSKGVTLGLLWQEYREQYSDGYQYSAFCGHYRVFAKSLPVTLRQSHMRPGSLSTQYNVCGSPGSTLTPPSNTFLGKPHGARLSAMWPKRVCI